MWDNDPMWSHDLAHDSILTKKKPHFKSQNEKGFKKKRRKKCKELKFYKIMARELYLKVKTITLWVTNLKNYIYILIKLTPKFLI